LRNTLSCVEAKAEGESSFCDKAQTIHRIIKQFTTQLRPRNFLLLFKSDELKS
jgi:hypothetical protein